MFVILLICRKENLGKIDNLRNKNTGTKLYVTATLQKFNANNHKTKILHRERCYYSIIKMLSCFMFFVIIIIWINTKQRQSKDERRGKNIFKSGLGTQYYSYCAFLIYAVDCCSC